MTGAITGSIVDFILDPYDPQNKAWVVTTATIYRTTNLDATPPTWSVIQTSAQMQTGMGVTFHSATRIISSIEQSGRYSVLTRRSPTLDGYVGTTTNNGTSWSWAAVRPSQTNNTWSAMDYAEHSGGLKIFVGNNNHFATYPSELGFSIDGGSTWDGYALGHSIRTRDILVPYGGNDNDNVIYVVSAEYSTTEDYIQKTINGGVTWTYITPSGFSVDDPGGNIGFNGMIIGDATTLYACGSGATSPLWKTTDGGSNWIKVNSDLGALARTLGLWPYNSDYIYMTLRNGGPYFSTNGGISFTNKSGNWTTAIGSLALSVQLVPVWVV